MPFGADTPAQAARKFSRLAADIPTMRQKALVASAQVMKQSAQGTLRIAAPRGQLNVGKRGARVGVRYDQPTPNTALVRMTGPAHLLESDTKPHRIPREKVGRGRARRANSKLISIPGVGVRAYANHPGTKGKHPWAKGVAIGKQRVDGATKKVLVDTMRRVF